MEKAYNHITDEPDGIMACEPIPSSWGGTWTEEKLDALEKYVNAYLTIMKYLQRCCRTSSWYCAKGI